eukprot:g48740.t1
MRDQVSDLRHGYYSIISVSLIPICLLDGLGFNIPYHKYQSFHQSLLFCRFCSQRYYHDDVATVTMDQLFLCRDYLRPLVTQSLDKNGNSLWVECPVLTYQTNVEGSGELSCVREVPEQFGRLNRKRSKIHCVIVFPKDKSQIEKTRLVCNQKRSPWRNVLRNLSRVLQFIILQLDGVLLHFNLPDLSKLRHHLTRATTRLRDFSSNSRVSVFQTDVKQMFIWLSHESVVHSLLFPLTAMKLYTRESKRSATYCDAFQ